MAGTEGGEMSGDTVCFYCEAPAVVFCDGILAWLRSPIPDEYDTHALPSASLRALRDKLKKPNKHVINPDIIASPGKNGVVDPRFTCDRPLCKTHTAHSGQIFFCRGKGAHIDSFDYCEQCDNEGRHHDAVGRDLKSVLVSQEEGKALQCRRLLKVAAWLPLPLPTGSPSLNNHMKGSGNEKSVMGGYIYVIWAFIFWSMATFFCRRIILFFRFRPLLLCDWRKIKCAPFSSPSYSHLR